MNGRKFIRRFLIAFSAVMIFIMIANYIIDPYGLHFHFRYRGFNTHKPTFLHFARISKLYNADEIEPEAIFLGNSRILYLVPEEAFGLYRPYNFYNFSLSSGTPDEMNDLLAYSIRNYDIEYACYGIDFITMINWSTQYASTFDTSLVKGDKSMFIELFKLHASTQAITESYSCVKSNINDPEGLYVRFHYNKYGSRTNKWREIHYKQLGDNWIDSEIKKVLNTYEPIYNNPKINIPEYKKDAYLSILDQCRDHGIEYAAFINPLYKEQFILLLKSPAYPVYIEFLKFIANNGGIWYFGGINKITSDKNYYWDSQHPRKKLSELIARAMFSDITPPYVDELFGKYYQSENIDSLVFNLDLLRESLIKD
jgi:hypothetical protein